LRLIDFCITQLSRVIKKRSLESHKEEKTLTSLESNQEEKTLTGRARGLVQVTTLSNGMRVATQASPGGSVCVGVTPQPRILSSMCHICSSMCRICSTEDPKL